MTLRGLLPLLLSALLAAASVAFAAAPRAMAGEEIVICRGNTIVTIVLGPDGEPLEQVHLCPDMGLWQVAGLPTASPAVVPPLRARRLSPRRGVSLRGRRTLSPRARGPPLSRSA